MLKLIKITNLRYPVSDSKREILASSFFVAVASYLFLIVFQPFGTYTFTHELKYLLLAPYALIASVSFALGNLALLNRNLRWNLHREVLKIACVLFVCSGLNYIYSIYFINHTRFDLHSLMCMYLYTFAAAVPVSMAYILVRYLYLSRNLSMPGESPPRQMLTISPDAGAEALTLPEEDFLFAESEGNYTTIHFLDKNVPRRQLMRLSLKNLEKQAGSGSIIRCHRSFIVNTCKVAKMKGNAQGYKLLMENTEIFIPVSRSYIGKIKKLAKQL